MGFRNSWNQGHPNCQCFFPLFFAFASLSTLKLHSSLPQSCLHNLWGPVHGDNMGTPLQKAGKSFFLFPWSFFKPIMDFFICYFISLSSRHGDTCRASATLIQGGHCDSVSEMCEPPCPSSRGEKGGMGLMNGVREGAAQSCPSIWRRQGEGGRLQAPALLR